MVTSLVRSSLSSGGRMLPIASVASGGRKDGGLNGLLGGAMGSAMIGEACDGTITV